MNGQSLLKAFVPLPGQAMAIYTSTGLDHYRHPDWLGSVRLTSSTSRTATGFVSYAPFGETESQAGIADLSITGQNQDTTPGLYDFAAREFDPLAGRWPSPDPAGLGAVSLDAPQTWNRYSYVSGAPLALTDPLGLQQQCRSGCGWRAPRFTPP
jgi:RHS repeat-associated protein